MITRYVKSLEDVKESLQAYQLTETEIKSLEAQYERINAMLERYIPDNQETRKIEVNFSVFRGYPGDRQLIADVNVSDRSIPVGNSYNWHLQNTSQWLFAGGWVFDTERRDFSLHT